jgi:hypothetical protein
MSADIEYNSTGTFNYTCTTPLYRCSQPLKDNSSILNIETPFWFVQDEIDWLTPKF